MCREEEGKRWKKRKKQLKKLKKNEKKWKKKHTNFLISFVFVFQRMKTNDMADEHEFYVLWMYWCYLKQNQGQLAKLVRVSC